MGHAEQSYVQNREACETSQTERIRIQNLNTGQIVKGPVLMCVIEHLDRPEGSPIVTVSTCISTERTYFRMFTRLNVNPPGLTLVNSKELSQKDNLFPSRQKSLAGSSYDGVGVCLYYLHRQKDGRKPIDVESHDKYFIVTSPVKDLFEKVDPAGFDFNPIKITYEDQTESSNHWLCDISRVLDAIDEEKSHIQILPGNPKIYSILGSTGLTFRDDVVEGAHVFRLAYAPRVVICDNLMRQACRDAKIKGLVFMELPVYK